MGKNLIISDFYCCICGAKGLPVWRKGGKERKAGHLKKLWCLSCGRETNHAECKPFTHYAHHQFLEEFYGNNFTPEGTRKKEYGIFKRDKVSNHEWENLQNLISELDNGN